MTESQLTKKPAHNQNYTPVPENSQIAASDVEEWDGTVKEQPDEDTREELNLPELNQEVIHTVVRSN